MVFVAGERCLLMHSCASKYMLAYRPLCLSVSLSASIIPRKWENKGRRGVGRGGGVCGQKISNLPTVSQFS